MEGRPVDEQFHHDLVVQAAAQQFSSSGNYTVLANPGSEKNARFGGEYPDIVVTGHGSGKVRFVMEVETPVSVNRAEVEQWRRYAKLGAPFYLIVPRLMLPLAQRLCTAGGVSCHFGHYAEDETGHIRIALVKPQA